MKKIEDNNTLVFLVDVKANKHQNKQAVKKLYDTDMAKYLSQHCEDITRNLLFTGSLFIYQISDYDHKATMPTTSIVTLSDSPSVDSPDSSTSPRVKLPPTSGEETTVRKEDTAQGKKQIRTVFSPTQLYVLND
ncbi:hypothetical protein GH733_000729 [Mirounga leonina]|nr:hypothetical protein GH733_000729 [Mirounga leonina]